ncbi:MAG: translation initiation factor IF-2 [Christensenellales bacterium]
MTENEKNTQKEGYQNLKSIHGLQVGGAIQNVLRDLRNTRHIAEQLAKQVSDIKKTKATQVHEQKESEVETSPKVQETIEVKTEKTEEKSFVQSKTFVERSNPKDRDFSQNHRQDFSKNNSQRQFQEKRNFQPNGQRPQGGNRPGFDRNNPNSRPQNGQFAQRPQNGGQQRPYTPRDNRQGAKTTFASSKGNNFKSFNEAPMFELPTQNKTFQNKNKNKNNVEEKNRTFVKKAQQRNNIIIEDDDGFSETTMGSRKLVKTKKKEQTFVAQAIENAVITSEEFTVKYLSEKTGRPVNEIIKKLMMLGVMANINSTITFDVAELVASELGVTLEKKIEKTYEEKLTEVASDKTDENAVKRPPIVTVMGHVDHGKTSLLDCIRNSSVVSGEAGGITQHIGAYQVTKNGEKITFIDTPGHAAFTAMRARGAKATDIAILVVAADDGIMPQTIEAINHIQAANVPMIVAVNKIDKPEANIDRVKQQLAEHNVLPEEWGGDAIIVPVSAKTKQGIDDLLGMILLVAEMQELKANPNRLATGVVLEASLDKNKGPIATILVQNGTLKAGDTFVCGLTFGKVRAMYDENGRLVKSAGPSCPVSVLGFDEVPNSGDMAVVIDEKFSKKVIEERKDKIKLERASSTSGVTLDDFMNKVNEGKLKNLNIIIKADVQGSVEALKQTLTEIENEEAKVVCLHAGAGAVTESDVLLASASSAVIIAFNVKTQPKAKQLAEQMKIEIKDYDIIYQAVDDLTAAINGMLTPKYEEKIVGHAEVRMVFKLTGVGQVVGSYITDGKAVRHAGVRITRGDEEIGSSTIESLRIQKDDKAEVNYGYECGIKLKDNFALKEGDKIEIFVKEQIKR